MASRVFYPPAGSLEREVVVLSGKIVFGASGAVTSETLKGATIAKRAASTGLYDITLDDKYPALLGFHVNYGSAAATDRVAVPVTEAVSTTKIVTFRIDQLDGSVAAADAASGDYAWVTLILKNTTI